MSRNTFNPEDWSAKNPSSTFSETNTEIDIEEITQKIEAKGVDIATSYEEWRNLGFSIATFLAEAGRTYYHRISRFHHNYTAEETDKQYDKCLKSNGKGITISTLYHLAKLAGVSLKSSPDKRRLPDCHFGNVAIYKNKEEPIEQEKLPTFPEKVFSRLPDFLSRICSNSLSSEDRDLLLLGAITTLSACLPNVVGQYGGITVYPNLFLYVTAQASAGKGRLSLCRRLVEPIHKELRQRNEKEMEQYRYKLSEYMQNKKDPAYLQPEEPPLRLLFIPANSSATAVFQILNDNNGVGLMFETEGDTLAQTFKSEHGNYSDGFRKAFHHEKISYLRRKDKEYVTLEAPRLSVLLSGTPRQVQSLIPDAENGLFSRFIFYCMNIHLYWYDVFASSVSGESLDTIFDKYGLEFYENYKILKESKEIHFYLTNSQQEEFNTYFRKTQLEYYAICGEDYIGTVRRLGLIAYRIALVLSTLRIMETKEIKHKITCSTKDFQISMEIVKTLIQHSAKIHNLLPKRENKSQQQINPKMTLLSKLPKTFSRAEYLNISSDLGIPTRTADRQIQRYIQAGFLNKSAYDQYEKISNTNE